MPHCVKIEKVNLKYTSRAMLEEEGNIRVDVRKKKKSKTVQNGFIDFETLSTDNRREERGLKFEDLKLNFEISIRAPLMFGKIRFIGSAHRTSRILTNLH